MPKQDHIQTSFAGGEFGASLFGRTDLDQYKSACAVVENMIVRPYGSLISAAGSEFIVETKDSSKKSRIIPFVFNRNDAYVIEMGENYLRFVTEDGYVTSTGTTPFEVVHPYEQSELFDVQFTQLNDLIWFFHPNHHPRRLIRYSSEYWELEDYSMYCEPFMDDNLTDTQLVVNNSTGTILITTTPTNATVFIASSSSTKGHMNTFWKIGGSTTNATTGQRVQGFVKITNIMSTSAASASVISALTITGGTLIWAEPAWSDLNGYPSCGTFFEQRLWMARTDVEPQKIWGSRNFVYDDFSANSAADDDGINIQLASNESNEIQWLVAGQSLIAGTFGGEFIVTGGDNPITPTNVAAKQQTSWGSEKIVPRRIGNYFYYIQRFGKKMRELFYHWDLDSYKSADRTILSPQVLGEGVVDMAYQQNPDTVVWCVLTNGTIATMTREIDQEMTAWTRQNTGDDLYESVCAIPSPTELYDQVWVVVNRTIDGATKRYIELFKSVDVPERQDECWYLHSALRYSAYDDTAGTPSGTTASISLSSTLGSIVITASTGYFAATDVDRRIRAIDEDGNTLGEASIDTVESDTEVKATIIYAFDGLSYAAGRWGVSVMELDGLEHLEAREVNVLADGGTDKPVKTVSGGTISLAYDYFVVLVGLSYTQKVRTLPAEAGTDRGTAQGKIQKISQVAVKVNRSFKGFKIGGDDTLAEKVQFRDPSTLMGTPEQLFTGMLANITFRDDYRYGSQVTIINEEPFPVEILSIISTVDTNDK